MIEQMNGMKMIENRHLTVEDGKTLKYVNRSLKERLFTKLYERYSSPLTKRKLISVIRHKPNPDVYVMGDRVLGHPETLRALKRKLDLTKARKNV